MTALNAGQPMKVGHLLAASDLSAAQYKAVKLTSSGIAVTAAGDGSKSALGILVNTPLQGDPCEIVTTGVVEAVAGAAITIGVAIVADAAGKVIAGTTPDANGVTWVALEAATGDNDLITILVR